MHYPAATRPLAVSATAQYGRLARSTPASVMGLALEEIGAVFHLASYQGTTPETL